MTGLRFSRPWHYVILILIAIGFITQLFRSPFSILIPLLLIGIVIYFYKHPPSWMVRYTSTNYRNPSPNAKTKARKRHTDTNKRNFRVIDGKK
ncbi:hypothetical protein IC620_12740 [Hazenella sp. IB182357]|uniref:Uncharacterized protein n=1 Tax=Polycladospora coralii TaxID=2771432 RepID=A0A926RTU3_9BACL|nr:hypothetical protein [Polycladospora coralii]MBD1373215.1 hypothetical protein [Polycladospora coralii]MBS7530873.1 hypothetical protein [Polycladospora coralii]